MSPASSICGFYFWHPDAEYFNVGSVGLDQVESYAKRSKITKDLATKNLRDVIPINATAPR